MAKIIEEEPTEKVVVHERDHDHIHEAPPRSNAALIVAIVIVILLLILLFGRGLFGGSKSTNVNVSPPTYKTTQ